MKLDFNLQVTQKQGIALTAQVQQAIKLLHMTNLEIQEFVTEQFQDNPFVETGLNSEENSNPKDEYRAKGDVDKDLTDTPYQQTENENKLSQENQFETGEGYIPKSTVSKENLDFDAISLIAEENNTYLHKLDIKTFKLIEPRINESIYNLLSPENSVKNKKSFGGTAFSQVKSAIKRARKKI